MRDEGSKDMEAAPAVEGTIVGVHVPHQAGGMAIQCQFCVGRNFRRSRWRKGDLRQVLLMRYPVRCLRCSQRQWVSFSVAGISVPSHVKHVPERLGATRRQETAVAAGDGPPASR